MEKIELELRVGKKWEDWKLMATNEIWSMLIICNKKMRNITINVKLIRIIKENWWDLIDVNEN